MSRCPLNGRFLIEVMNYELISRNGYSTGSVLFKMAAAASWLNFEKRLPLVDQVALVFTKLSPNVVKMLRLHLEHNQRFRKFKGDQNSR